MRPLIVCAVLLCACHHDPVAPEPAVPVVRYVAITANAPSVWAIKYDSTTGPFDVISLLGNGAPFDTLRLERDSVVVFGTLLNTQGFPVCHDTKIGTRGQVTVLDCHP